jgi:hypothetical protein
VYGDQRGPDCLHLPGDPFSQENLPPAEIVPDIVDGVDEPTGKTRPAPLARLLLDPLAPGTEVSAR